jgi:hypothetical protein
MYTTKHGPSNGIAEQVSNGTYHQLSPQRNELISKSPLNDKKPKYDPWIFFADRAIN